MNIQDQSSTLHADSLDDAATSDSHHDISGSTWPAPSRFCRSGKSNHKDRSSTTVKVELAVKKNIAIRKLMARSIGHDLTSCESASWERYFHSKNSSAVAKTTQVGQDGTEYLDTNTTMRRGSSI
jgi:hypothetical protein